MTAEIALGYSKDMVRFGRKSFFKREEREF
jgi:hypothetical protein